MSQLRVLLATSWGDQLCGINEHSKLLIEAVKQADPEIEITPSSAALDPYHVSRCDVLHINYHRALASRWTADMVEKSKVTNPVPYVITFHDTIGELPPDQLSQDLCTLADAFIVHEPCEGLERAIYWRMGVPELRGGVGPYTAYQLQRPILGTVGFPFPWKNLPQMAATAASVGWGLQVFCPHMDTDQEAAIRSVNPWTTIRRGFPQDEVLQGLSYACDASAFLFTCANTGQSASILQGVGARKPVIAFSTCRQMRSLYLDPCGREVISWAETFEDVKEILWSLPLSRFSAPICALAEQDSWVHLGKKYASLYRQLVA